MYDLERYSLMSDLFKFNYLDAKYVSMVTEKLSLFYSRRLHSAYYIALLLTQLLQTTNYA